MSEQICTYVFHPGTGTYWSADSDDWYLVHVPQDVCERGDGELEDFLEVAVLMAEAGNNEATTYGPGLL